jgi:hypothetical protein
MPFYYLCDKCVPNPRDVYIMMFEGLLSVSKTTLFETNYLFKKNGFAFRLSKAIF